MLVSCTVDESDATGLAPPRYQQGPTVQDSLPNSRCESLPATVELGLISYDWLFLIPATNNNHNTHIAMSKTSVVCASHNILRALFHAHVEADTHVKTLSHSGADINASTRWCVNLLPWQEAIGLNEWNQGMRQGMNIRIKELKLR
jgi:hypothetical protein